VKTTRLFLVRHGEAANIGGEIKRDADRPLTEAGIDASTGIARVIGLSGEKVHVILTSPLTRAVQTARRIAELLPGHPVVRETGNLSPGFRPPTFIAEVNAVEDEGAVVAVGHQPDIGILLSYLVADAAPLGCAIPAGAVMSIGLKSSGGESDAMLEWFLSPHLLRTLSTPVHGGQ
jgi:phosphohistidine phosphatase